MDDDVDKLNAIIATANDTWRDICGGETEPGRVAQVALMLVANLARVVLAERIGQ